MPLTPKQEAFVQAYHRLGNQRHAYKASYDAENMSDLVIDNKASLLMKRGDVRVRLQELQDKAAKKNEITIETITKMLAGAYKMATEQKQASAAVAASMGLGKLHGLIVEKREDVTARRPSSEIDALIHSLVNDGEERAPSGVAGRTESSSEPGEALPTVSGHGTA